MTGMHISAQLGRKGTVEAEQGGQCIPVAYGLFFTESLRSLKATASLVPSSRFLSSALLDPIDLRNARLVVELGCGTGAVTCEILSRMGPGGQLLTLDTNEKFIRHLRQNCRDPRLLSAHASAEELPSVLRTFRLRSANAIVSSLGLTQMDPELRLRIIRYAYVSLDPGAL